MFILKVVFCCFSLFSAKRACLRRNGLVSNVVSLATRSSTSRKSRIPPKECLRDFEGSDGKIYLGAKSGGAGKIKKNWALQMKLPGVSF